MLYRLINKYRGLAKHPLQRCFSEGKSLRLCFMTGSQSFEEMVKNADIFVDKTLFIHELLKSSNQAFSITRPRRWGKTLNLSMLKYFFQPDVDINTGEIFYDKKSKKCLFEEFKIKDAILNYNPITYEKKDTRLIDCQGSFPVINFGFRGNVADETKDLIEYFTHMITPAFEEHSYLLKSKGQITDYAYRLLEKIIKRKGLNEDELKKSLSVLIEVLHKHYGRKVVVLLDEYDKYLMNSAKKFSPLHDYALALTKDILSPIKKNKEMLQLTVFTGESTLLKGEIFTELNHFFHDSIMHSDYSKFFGFTEPEIDDIVTKILDLRPSIENEDIKDRLKVMYNGYNIGGEIIYNPWSIMNTLDYLPEKPHYLLWNYWVGSGSLEIVNNAVKNLSSVDKVENLLYDGYVEFKYRDSYKLETINSDEDDLLSFLVDFGYLTNVEGNLFRIPNNEIIYYFNKELLKVWLKRLFNDLSFDQLKQYDIEEYEEYVEWFQHDILNKISINKINLAKLKILITSLFKKECNFFNYFFHETEALTKKKSKIDIILQPDKGESLCVYIFEFKINENNEDENLLMEEAYRQMFIKKYPEYILELANENKHWKYLYLRVLIFTPDKLNEKWIMSNHEIQFRKDGLKRAFEDFNNKAPKKNEMINFLWSYEKKFYQD